MIALRARAARALGSGLVFALFVMMLTVPSTVSACASCGCGDPTLTAVGVEQPYKNRLRLVLEERVGTRTSGADVMRERLVMTRTQLGIAYTPHARITLAAFMPLIASTLTGPTGASQHIVGIGELELQARVLVARDRSFAPRHLFWLVAGLKTPTTPRIHDDAGFPYPDDDQPGSGSWDPLGGATYAWFGGFVSVYSSFLFRIPTDGERGYRRGRSILSASAVQLQPLPRLAIQLGANLHYLTADALSNGAPAPNTGGFVAAIAPGLLINPWRDLLLRVAVEVPVYQSMNGVQSLGPQGVLAISYDIL